MNQTVREAIINGKTFRTIGCGCYLEISKSRAIQYVSKSNGNCILKMNENTENCVEIHFHTHNTVIQIWK